MRRIVAIVVALLAAGCTTMHQSSHVGFHFQGDLGVGGSQSTASDAGDEVKYSGPGGLYSLAVGGSVVPNLIIGAQLWGASVSDVRLTVNGSSQTLDGITYQTYGFGPMVKFYAMPANIYLAVTPSIAQLRLSDDNQNEDTTKWGPALRLAVGKEWYVSQRWGMGLAGVLHVASNDAEGGGPKWKTVGGGVVFSASFD
jgi:hypothetical protein